MFSLIHATCVCINCLGFLRRIGIFQPCNGGDYLVNDKLCHFEVFLEALTRLLFYEIQRNGLFRAKGVVMIDTGNHLTSHPTEIKIYKYGQKVCKTCKRISPFKFCCKNRIPAKVHLHHTF